jgi:ATP-dependent RNA helicase DDX49/DBP8
MNHTEQTIVLSIKKFPIQGHSLSQMSGFSKLGLPDFLVQTCKQIGLTSPTPVQLSTIPQILSGRNVAASSPTGTGKTAAFALPIIAKLSADPCGIFCVVLSPTRELSGQIADQFRLFGHGMRITVAHIHGAAAFCEQASVIGDNPHILVATPGRLLQHLESATEFSLDYLQFLVLDEVDRLFKDGFWTDVLKIIARFPKERQTLVFSATLGADIPIAELLGEGHFLWRPLGDQSPSISHFLMPVPGHVREVFVMALLEEIQKNSDFSQTIVFTNHCDTTETLALILRALGFKTAMIHSKMAQEDRFLAVSDFKANRQRVLVATDVAARGLDIPFVDHVVHYNPPPSATIYVHRAGRTGRAGRSGRSILFVNRIQDAEIVEQIEKEIGKQLEIMEIDEKETVGRVKKVLAARTRARVSMFEHGFGEREKRIQNIKDAREGMMGADEPQPTGAVLGLGES